jgi:uncharacterized protein (DUF486 family)
MKKNAFKILIPILLSNIILFLVSFFLLIGDTSKAISIDPLQTAIQISMILLLVLNVSILLTFLIYRKLSNKPKPWMIFLLVCGIFLLEVFLLFRNITQFDQTLANSFLGLSSFTASLLLFVLFNISAAYVITRYRKRKTDDH